MGTGNIQTLVRWVFSPVSAAPAHQEGWWLSLPSMHIIPAVLGALQLAQLSTVQVRRNKSQGIVERGRLLHWIVGILETENFGS